MIFFTLFNNMKKQSGINYNCNDIINITVKNVITIEIIIKCFNQVQSNSFFEVIFLKLNLDTSKCTRPEDLECKKKNN